MEKVSKEQESIMTVAEYENKIPLTSEASIELNVQSLRVNILSNEDTIPAPIDALAFVKVHEVIVVELLRANITPPDSVTVTLLNSLFVTMIVLEVLAQMNPPSFAVWLVNRELDISIVAMPSPIPAVVPEVVFPSKSISEILRFDSIQ